MGKKKLLFSQKELKSMRIRFEKSREDLLKERLNLDEKGLENLLTGWENEKEERKIIRRIKIKEEKSKQFELFPEQKERALWQNSIKELSASKLTTYWGCPAAYLFHYIMHEEVPQSPSKIFGKEIHYIIECFHKMNFKSDESFIKFWKHRWWGVVNGKYGDIEINFKSREQAGQLCGLGINILKPFYEHNKKLPKPLMVEEDFSKYNIMVEGVKLTGKLDRVDEMDGKIIITDYKTDFFSPAQNTFLLHRHPQFTFYALAWYLKNKEIPHLAMHHLRSGKVFKTRRTQDDFDYLTELIIQTKQRVTSGNFTPFYGFHCKSKCDLMEEVCRMYGFGVGSKLKRLEQQFNGVEPEIDKIFSYDVQKSKIRVLNVENYVRKGDFENAYDSLLNHLTNMNCPLEVHEGALACLVWDEESPLRLPDPEIDR